MSEGGSIYQYEKNVLLMIDGSKNYSLYALIRCLGMMVQWDLWETFTRWTDCQGLVNVCCW